MIDDAPRLRQNGRMIDPPPPPRILGKGYKPDTHDRSKDPSIRALLGAVHRGLSASSSLENYIVSINNQGATQSCVGWAFAQAILLRCRALGMNVSILPSPLAIYTFSRAIERGQASKDALQDDGCSPGFAVQGLGLWGAPLITDWPFDPELVNVEPTFEEIEQSAGYLFTGFARIDSTGDQRLSDIRQAISQNYPVIFGTKVDAAFEAYNGIGPDGKPAPFGAVDTSHSLGGHMMNYVGYNSDGTFRVLNQWGQSWGLNGLATVSTDFVVSDATTDIYVLSASAPPLERMAA